MIAQKANKKFQIFYDIKQDGDRERERERGGGGGGGGGKVTNTEKSRRTDKRKD